MNIKGEIIYGVHPVTETLRSRKRNVLQMFIVKGRSNAHLDNIIVMAKRMNVPLLRVEQTELDRIAARGNHQGIVITAEPLRMTGLSDAIDGLNGRKNAVWLAVDEITDPQNLGSMLRSAACFGVDTVLLPENRTVGITPAVHKAACGALERLTIVKLVNLNNTVRELKDHGFWVYGADMKGTPINKMKYNTPALLIIGSEGTGLREKTREHCDEIVSIPQKGSIDSLNAGVAAAIVMQDMAVKARLV